MSLNSAKTFLIRIKDGLIRIAPSCILIIFGAYMVLSPIIHMSNDSDNESDIVCDNQFVQSEVVQQTVDTQEITEDEDVEQVAEETTTPKEEPKTNNKVSNTKFGTFKSYTNYKLLARNSAQWKLQTQAYTDENGLRKIGDAYLVAMGSYYGRTLGTEYTVVLSNGNTFQIILCDFKKDIHTDSKNQATISDGSVLEFYIDNDTLPKRVKQLGDISAIPFFNGGIVSITKN